MSDVNCDRTQAKQATTSVFGWSVYCQHFELIASCLVFQAGFRASWNVWRHTFAKISIGCI